MNRGFANHTLCKSVTLFANHPPSISDEELEVNICKALPLIEHEVKPDDLQACHCLKKKSQLLYNLNVGNLNGAYLLTGKTSEITLKIYAS